MSTSSLHISHAELLSMQAITMHRSTEFARVAFQLCTAKEGFRAAWPEAAFCNETGDQNFSIPLRNPP
jgi:hypothetical protein